MTSSQELSRFDIDNREILWQGVVKTDFIQFEASAKFAAGADPSNVKELTFTWSSLLPDTILIHGRIRKDVADEYLKSFQWSSKDIIIMTVEPDKNGQPGFDELFEYFSVRQRYGVGSNHYNKAIKDIYVIPIKKQKTAAKEAAFLSLLDNDYLHQAATTDMFLLVFTATIRELGQNAATGLNPPVYRESEDNATGLGDEQEDDRVGQLSGNSAQNLQKLLVDFKAERK